MKVSISKKQFAHIVAYVSHYKAMWVTTRGQMFQDEKTALEAVRTLNVIIDEPDDYVGILKITTDMLSVCRLRAFFENIVEYFKTNATVPRQAEKKVEVNNRAEKAKAIDVSEILDELEDEEDDGYTDEQRQRMKESYAKEQEELAKRKEKEELEKAAAAAAASLEKETNANAAKDTSTRNTDTNAANK